MLLRVLVELDCHFGTVGAMNRHMEVARCDVPHAWPENLSLTTFLHLDMAGGSEAFSENSSEDWRHMLNDDNRDREISGKLWEELGQCIWPPGGCSNRKEAVLIG